MNRARAALLLAAWLGSACGGGDAPPSLSSSLPPGAVARAGSELVSETTVLRIARAQRVAPRAALNAALSDAVFAQSARAELGATRARSLERVAAARSLLEALLNEATGTGPATFAELDKIAQDRWTDLNRPDAVRTTHAVVLNDKPARDDAARAVAEKLAVALSSATSEDELIRLAGAFPGEGFEIRAEALPFVTADGRVLMRREGGFVAQSGPFDAEFARGANALLTPGQLSGPVKSAFGYHVIRLEERAAGNVVPQAELKALLGDEVMQRRAKRARRELVDRLRGSVRVQLERAADELTAQVKVAP